MAPYRNEQVLRSAASRKDILSAHLEEDGLTVVSSGNESEFGWPACLRAVTYADGLLLTFEARAFWLPESKRGNLRRGFLSLRQLAPARLRDFNQGFDADQPALVVLEAARRFFPLRHEPVHPLAQEYDVLAVLDQFGDETHRLACGVKSSTIP